MLLHLMGLAPRLLLLLCSGPRILGLSLNLSSGSFPLHKPNLHIDAAPLQVLLWGGKMWRRRDPGVPADILPFALPKAATTVLSEDKLPPLGGHSMNSFPPPLLSREGDLQRDMDETQGAEAPGTPRVRGSS